MNSCTVDKQGRIVIPSTWRAKQGITPGTKLVVAEGDDGGLRVLTFLQSVRRAQEIVRRNTRPGGGSAVDELLRQRRREVALFEKKMKRYERGNDQRSG